MDTYRNVVGPEAVPQSEPVDQRQSRNLAGGYSYAIDDWGQLTRFLILGSQGGTYYVGERALTKENLLVVERLLATGRGRAVIDKILEISQAGRAVSNDPALFALARCGSWSDDELVCAYALSVLPQVARTGIHLLHFVSFIRQFRRGGPRLKKALAEWYDGKEVDELAYQVVKYQQRDGWSHRDVFRVAHPEKAGADEARNILYHWIVKGWESVGEEPHPIESLQLVWAFERAKQLKNEDELIELIQRYRLSREAVPTETLKSVRVWEALLQTMPLEAMLRNLGVMTKIELLKPLSKATELVSKRLRDEQAIVKARLHPIKILAALTTYESGKGLRGSNTWEPVREIVDALNDAFYLAFTNVEPSGKRLLLALDTSGSMRRARVNGIPGVQCHTVSGAMSLITAAAELTYHIIGVDTRVQPLTISPSQRLDDVIRILNATGGGGTNLALPMEYALEKGMDVDAFVIYTDSETWAGRQHPVVALQKYRDRTGIPSRVINVQMASTRTTNNDPEDALALEMVGFDTTAPQVISEFISGAW